MNLPEYEVKPGSEAAWAGVSVAVGALVGAVLTALEVDGAIVGAASTLAASLTRIAIGFLLPTPKPVEPPSA